MNVQNNILQLPRPVVPVDAKWAFTTRLVQREHAKGIDLNFAQAVSGDLVVLCVGDRYALDQFGGIAEIAPLGTDLSAGGGIAGRMLHAHDQMSKPTQLEPLGLVTDHDGQVINIASYALPLAAIPQDLVATGIAAFATRDLFEALHKGIALPFVALTTLVAASISVIWLRVWSRVRGEKLGQSYAA